MLASSTNSGPGNLPEGASVSVKVTSIQDGVLYHEVIVFVGSSSTFAGGSGSAGTIISPVQVEIVISSALSSTATMDAIANSVVSAGQASDDPGVSATLTSSGASGSGLSVDAHNALGASHHGAFSVPNLDVSSLNAQDTV